MAIEALSDIQRASASAFAPGGSAAITRAVVAVSPAVFGHAFVTVADASVSNTSKIMAFLEPSNDFDADDLDDVTVSATAGTGSIIFCLSSLSPIVGTYDILYMVGA